MEETNRMAEMTEANEAESARETGGAERLTRAADTDWREGAGEDLLVAQELGHEAEAGEEGDILATLTERRDDALSERTEPDEETVEALRARLTQRRERERVRSEFAQNLIAQEDEIRKSDPDFDLEQMVRASPAFRALILAGERVERALDYVKPERVRLEAERRVTENIRRRSLRPRPMAAANARDRVANVSTMTEAELRRIDERLKSGQKVYL